MWHALTWHSIFAALLVVFSTSFPFGYNGNLLNQPYSLVHGFFNKTFTERSYDGALPSNSTITWLWSVTNAVYVVGIFIGYFFGAFQMDKLGRKKAILLGQVFLIAGTTLSTCCVIGKSPELLIIGRVLIGILGGVGNSTIPIFLAEISPRTGRGALGVLHQMGMVTGILTASIIGLPEVLSTVDTWPYLHLMNVLCAITAVIFLPHIPETPRFLYLVVGNEQKARSSLVWYRGRTDVDVEMNEMEKEKQLHILEPPVTWKDMFHEKKLHRPLFIACMMQLNRHLTGMQPLTLYSASIFRQAGLDLDTIPFTVVGLCGTAVVANIIAVPLIDNVGRRPLLIVSMSVMLIDLIVFTAVISIKTEHHWAAFFGIACVYIHVMMTNVGIGSISWILSAELFEQRTRPRAGLVAGVVFCVAYFIVLLGFEPLYNAIYKYVFVVLAAFVVVFLVFTVLMVPETKNKTFAEIAETLSRPVV